MDSLTVGELLDKINKLIEDGKLTRDSLVLMHNDEFCDYSTISKNCSILHSLEEDINNCKEDFKYALKYNRDAFKKNIEEKLKRYNAIGTNNCLCIMNSI